MSQAYAELYPQKMRGFVSIDFVPLQLHYMVGAEIWMLKHTEGIYSAYPWKALVRDETNGCAETQYGRDLMRETQIPIYRIPGAGHNSNTNAADEINRITEAFLSESAAVE